MIVRDNAVEVSMTMTETRFRARRALVATGLSDDLPDIPGLRDQWGRGVVVCPYCDGWEHRLDVIGVIATSPRSVEQAQLLRQWSERVVYFPGAFGEPDAGDAAALADRGIRIELGDVAGLRIDGDRLTGVELGDRVVPVGVVFVGTRLRPHDSLLRAVGAAPPRTRPEAGLQSTMTARPACAGVYAVGNVVNPRSNVSVSLGLGTLVGGSINLDLLADDIAQAGLARRQLSARLLGADVITSMLRWSRA